MIFRWFAYVIRNRCHGSTFLTLRKIESSTCHWHVFTLTVADRICIIACCDFLKAGFHIIAPIYPGDHYGDYTEIRLYGIKVVPPQEGGGVSRVNIGRLITTSVTSRHTSMFFQNGGQFSCSLFLQKMTIFRRSGKLFCRARMTKHLKNRKE